MTKYVQERVENMEKPITVWVIIGFMSALVLTYGLLLNATVMNAVSTNQMKKQVEQLTSSVANLESSYLSAKENLTLEYAKSIGFSESSKNIAYVNKSLESFSFNR